MTRCPDLPAVLRNHPQLEGERWRLRRRIDGRHTRLYEYVSSGPDVRRIFVKNAPPRGTGALDPRLLREFRALRVLQRKLGPELGPSLPAPLAMAHGHHLIVTGAVPGMPLSRVLKRDANLVAGFFRLRGLRRSGRAVGSWLKRFHELTRRPDIAHVHEQFCRDLDADLQRLGHAVDHTALVREVARIREASVRLAGRAVPAAGRHADFLPQNILIGSKHVGAVDFENYRRCGVVHMDAGSLLAYMALLEHRPGYLNRAIRAFTSGFTGGYGPLASGRVQNLFTAAAAIRIARDSPRAHVRGCLARTLARLPL